MSISISANTREGRGKSAARALRAAGRIPAVIYGHGLDEALAISLDPKPFRKALENPKGTNELFSCEVEGKGTFQVLVREIQRHPVKRNLLHVDLVAPNPDKKMLTAVPLSFEGRCIGVSMGGQLRTPYREVIISAKPADFPAAMVIDTTDMNIGFTMMASELPLPEGVEAVYDRDYMVIKVAKARGKAVVEEGDEPAAEAEAEE